MTELTISTHVVGAGEDAITYDVQGDLTSGTPLILLGAPMDASGFRQLADQFPDRPVVTYDPRGAGRNPTGTTTIPTEVHADDIHRVIADLGVGPVDAFGNSGGAVNLLAAAAAHPEDFRLIVAHEPPNAPSIADGDELLAAIYDIKSTYAEKGNGPAMAKFIALVMTQGPVPADFVDQPAPDPAMFGMSSEDDGDRTNPLIRNMPAIIEYEVDVDALRAFGDRLVIGYGAESGEEMASRAGRGIAAQIGIQPVEFPGGHGAFHDEPMYPGIPVEFGVKLREVLDR